MSRVSDNTRNGNNGTLNIGAANICAKYIRSGHTHQANWSTRPITGPPMRTSFLTRMIVWLTYGLALSGCSQLEPHSRASWETDSRVSTEEVMSCAQKTIQALSVKNPKWETTVTRLDIHDGTLETGDYPNTNATGLRTRVTFQPEAHQLIVDIKGSGPYYMDLGAKEGAFHFRHSMENCLAR